jgi:hypothetical protein
MPVSSSYPIDLEVDAVHQVPRWRPLVNWLLVIPVSIWASLLGLGAMAVSFIGWFVILFTGQLPRSFGDYLVAVLRYHWRAAAYLYAFTDEYPGFRTVAGYVDPGDYPAILYSARPTARSRVTVAFRFILVIPQAFVFWFISIAAGAVLLAAWFVVLVIGRWPDGMRNFVIGYMRWGQRLAGYGYLLVDDYPPFALES